MILISNKKYLIESKWVFLSYIFWLLFMSTNSSFGQQQIISSTHSTNNNKDNPYHPCTSGKEDCIWVNGKLEPFYPDKERKLGNFVGSNDPSASCDNRSGLEKNMGRLIRTVELGKSERCEVKFGPDAKQLDRLSSSTGQLFDLSHKCKKENGNPCSGNATLVTLGKGEGNFLVTAAHVFLPSGEKEIPENNWKDFSFNIRLGSDEKGMGRYKRFYIASIQFGTRSPQLDSPDLKDYAFIWLKDNPSAYSKDVKPINIKPDESDESFFSHKALLAGYAAEVDPNDPKGNMRWFFKRSCELFNIFKLPTERDFWVGSDMDKSLFAISGASLDGYSGAGIVALTQKGEGVYLGLHRGWYDRKGNSNSGEEFNISSRFNYAISVKSFYNELLLFNKKQLALDKAAHNGDKWSVLPGDKVSKVLGGGNGSI